MYTVLCSKTSSIYDRDKVESLDISKLDIEALAIYPYFRSYYISHYG